MAEEDVVDPLVLLEQAEQYRAECRWDKAVAALRPVTALKEKDAGSASAAHVLMARCFLAAKRTDQAELELKRVLTEFGDQAAARFWAQLYITDVLLAQGKPVDAEAHVRRLAAEPGQSPAQRAWTKVKLAEAKRGRWDGTPFKPDLEEVIAEAGEDRSEPHNWARVRLAEALADDWSLSRAKELCDAVVADRTEGKATQEQTAWALVWKGWALAKGREHEAARQSWLQVVNVGEGRFVEAVSLAELYLGGSYCAAGQHEEAVKHHMAAHEAGVKANVPDENLDHMKLQVGLELHHASMSQRAIAWLRSGISDPARLTAKEHELIERISDFLDPAQLEAWHLYLLKPANQTDPTDVLVRAEFGTGASVASETVVTELGLRWRWLGQAYRKSGTLESARAAFQKALQRATTSAERAEALTGLLLSCERGTPLTARREMAEQVAAAWVQAIRQMERDGDAQYAVEAACAAYTSCGLSSRIREMLEKLIQDPAVSSLPGVACFVQLNLALRLAHEGKLAEAVTMYSGLVERYLDLPFGPGHAILCKQAMLQMAYLQARQGDLSASYQTLDDLTARWPEEFEPFMIRHRAALESSALAASKGQ
ncbi:MAG: hypothetical protein AMXMBFR13_25340 [Phycisphaerae bacterium]